MEIKVNLEFIKLVKFTFDLVQVYEKFCLLILIRSFFIY